MIIVELTITRVVNPFYRSHYHFKNSILKHLHHKHLGILGEHSYKWEIIECDDDEIDSDLLFKYPEIGQAYLDNKKILQLKTFNHFQNIEAVNKFYESDEFVESYVRLKNAGFHVSDLIIKKVSESIMNYIEK